MYGFLRVPYSSKLMILKYFISIGRSAEEISDFLKPLDLPDMKYVIVPVNDHSSLDGAGGTHWYVQRSSCL